MVRDGLANSVYPPRGYLSLDGARQAARTWNEVTPQTLAHLVYVGGSTFGIEAVDIAVHDAQASSNYATAQAVTAGPNAPDPVLALLHDAELRFDVAAGLSANALSYRAMLKVLGDAALGGVSSGEFADLQTLAASLNAEDGIAVSQYVGYITGQLINGNPWNASWTGGAVATDASGKHSAANTALGNLSAGTSQDNMNLLIGKWFLGTDLPAPVFENNAVATYRASSDPLFNADGLSAAGGRA